MRLAYLCTDFGIPVYGSKGAAIHIREMCRALHALGHDVLVLSPRLGGERPTDFDVPVRELELDQMEKATYSLLRDDPGAGEAMAKEVRSLVYTNSFRHRARRVLRHFDPDMIYERYSLFGTAGIALAQDLQVPLMMEVNAPLSEEHAIHRQLTFAGTARGLERIILRSADRLVAVSEEIKIWLVEVGVEPKRVTVLPNGVDVARFEAGIRKRGEVRTRLGLDGQPVIGFLGTLKAWHGTETLLRAVAILRQRGLMPYLLVVGEGPERAALEETARREGIDDRTVFTGAIPHEHVPAHIAAMDVATAPYDQREGFYFSPLKLFEYMATGRPVVAADVGQIRTCIRHAETGLLYPPGDAGALADALGSLLQDPSRALALGRAGQEYVREHHTWEGNARAMVELAQRLLPGDGEGR